ncbi:hypothetical protein EMIHUDRAFT_210105 [Emiliania huxleyi CCMP1516]|uniref:Uncharacterized protein n=2 Tax=Emiliania huxleyi TaxID=2903 RepID=A0A0D3J1N0_EMIH1|nr:hypothetical protein EMIHUDRAFT_210105 [Emiliania huxleyi CCMP1516]EOD17415.1 hypothetical protein EMIHUDRAFT_210105 [Emiliania huxleyi CCMP1516]|eukprot:XP_005769844.1 hypothetical protein EMIHUDRAFT_210105 [Emiliania huxleyi CCMP1516]
MGGDGICDVNAMLVTEGYGPVVTSPGHSGHKWNDYVDKQADLGRSGARDCDAPEWQDESIPTDADDGESSTVGDDVARHIGDNKGIRRERAIDIDVDPADSTDVDVITSAATALSLDDTVENRTEDLAEAIGRITLGPDPAPTPRAAPTPPGTIVNSVACEDAVSTGPDLF